MYGRKSEGSLKESIDLLNYHGRKFRKSSTTSSFPGVTLLPGRTESSGMISLVPSSSPGISHSSSAASQIPLDSRISPPGGMSPGGQTSLTRSIILPPPQPSPMKSTKGRPFSAARRTSTARPKSISPLQPSDEFRLQFALQHSKPLPPITMSTPSPTLDDQLPHPATSPTLGNNQHHQMVIANPTLNDQLHPKVTASPTLDNKLITEVDSAVDLEYYSQCGTPVDLPLSIDGSANTQYLVANRHARIGERLSDEQDNLSLHTLKLATQAPTSTGNQTVTVCLKLPNGDRLPADLPLSTTLEQVVLHAENCSGMTLKKCIISTNEIPKQVFTDWSLTLYDAGIVYRTVLHFSFP